MDAVTDVKRYGMGEYVDVHIGLSPAPARVVGYDVDRDMYRVRYSCGGIMASVQSNRLRLTKLTPEFRVCSACGGGMTHASGYDVCTECGHRYYGDYDESKTRAACPSCGWVVMAGARSCDNCGLKLSDD